MNRNDEKNIFVLGITGGIGVGKSTVTNMLESFGAKIIDCDKVSKELSQREDIIKEISITFGNTLVGKDGKLDRKLLASIVFNDKKKLELLNKIMHKKVVDEIFERLNHAKTGDVYVIDAPIPVKEGFLDTCDQIWTIITNKQVRIDRVIRRDNIKEEEVLSRINAQFDEASYKKIANKVLYNDGDIVSLKKQVESYWFNFMEFKKG